MIPFLLGHSIGARQRRVRISQHSDGTATIASAGPGLVRRAWRSLAATWVVFVVAFSLLTPFQTGSNGAVWWALAWATGLTLLFAAARRAKA